MARRNQPKAYKHHRLEWPNNLLDAIFGDGFHKTNTITEDQLAAINYVIVTGLDTRQQEVIHHRYTKGMSLIEIGEIYGLSRERVRQIETKAIHILKNPVRANIIKVGLTTFYEQDIKNLYYTRQNLLTTSLADINITAGNTVTEKARQLIIEHGFVTVGDLLDFNLNDKHDLQLSQNTYMEIVKHYQTVIFEQNLIISALEYHTGNFTKPTIPYPTNLFDALYGKSSNHHKSNLPNKKQIDGLNYLMSTVLNEQHQQVLSYIYELGLSVHGCGAKMHITSDKVRMLHREALRMLRTQPDCYAYIDGLTDNLMPDFSQSTNTDIQNLNMHETVKTAIINHGITSVQDMLSRPNAELLSIPHIGNQLLSEIDTHFPIRRPYSKLCDYLSSVGVSHAEQTVLVNTTYFDGKSAYDILMSDDEAARCKVHHDICLRATSVETSPYLSVRAKNVLRHNEIHTFKDLYGISDDELMAMKNIGELTLANIKDSLNTVLRNIA